MKAVRYAQHVLAQKEYAEGAECLQYNELIDKKDRDDSFFKISVEKD